jgi:hypothetical protein
MSKNEKGKIFWEKIFHETIKIFKVSPLKTKISICYDTFLYFVKKSI